MNNIDIYDKTRAIIEHINDINEKVLSLSQILHPLIKEDVLNKDYKDSLKQLSKLFSDPCNDAYAIIQKLMILTITNE